MYGDNKANEPKNTLLRIRNSTETLHSSIVEDMKHKYTKEDVLALSILSQEITDKLNQLYEQMKGE